MPENKTGYTSEHVTSVETALYVNNPEKKDKTHSGEVWERATRYFKEEHVFHYGQLPEDHPAQIYINNLIRRLPPKPDFEFKVIISPDWREINAASLPDGTILISLGLLQNVETEEALLGVLAHERTHAYKEHSKKQAKKAVTSISKFLERVSLQRGHEYEADLRGALLDMEEAKSNPIAYKMFLEKLHTKEASGGGITHGSSLDRALNIASAVHLVDFKSIAQDAHPVPEEIVKSVSDIEPGTYSRRAVARRPKSLYFSEEDLQQKQELRRETIEELQPEELPFALEAVYKYTRSREDREADPEDEKAFARLVERFQQGLVPANLDEKDRQLLTAFGVELFGDINVIASQEKFLQNLSGPVKNLLRSRQGLHEAQATLLKYFESSPLPYVAKSPSMWMEHMLSFVIEENVFGEFSKGNIDIEGVKEFIEDWATLFEAVSKNLYIGTSRSEESFKGILVRRLIAAAKPESQEALAQALGGETKTREQSLEQYYAEGIKVGKITDPEKQYQALYRLRKRLEERFKDADIKQIGAALQEMINGMHLGVASTIDFTLQKKGEEDTLTALERENARDFLSKPERNIGILFKDLLEELAQFTHIPADQKNLIIISVALRLGSNGWLDEAKGLSTILENPADPRRQRLKRGIKQTEQLFTTKSFFLDIGQETEGSIELVYRYLFDSNFFKEHTGFTSFIEDENQGTRERLFVQKAVNWLIQTDLHGIFERINTLENKGVPVQELLAKKPTYCGPLVVKLNEAIKKELLKEETFDNLIRASQWITNPFLQTAFQRHVKDLYWDKLDFSEKLDIVFPLEGQTISDPQVQESFLEHDMRTREEYEIVKKRINEKIDVFLEEGGEKAGVAVLLSHLNFEHKDVNLFFKALLQSATNDRELKRIVYELVTDLLRFRREDEEGAVSADGTDDDDEKHGIESIKTRVRTADAILRSLYSLDNYGRQLLLRSLMTSEWGTLPNPEKRKRFLGFLLNEWLEGKGEQQDIHKVLQNVREGLEAIPEWQLLYFALQNALRDKIAQPPDKKQAVPWSDMYEVESDLEAYDLDSDQIRKQLSTIVWTSVPKVGKKEPHKYFEEYTNASEHQLRILLEAKSVLVSQKQQKFTPLQFVTETVSRTGAPGVRFLQLLPQFVNISPEYEREFSGVYDAIKGQSKLAAISLLEREWPEVWDEIEYIGDRVGGGAAVTVYEARKRSGEKIVVKARNPNIEYHLNEMYRFAGMVIDRLAKKHGGGYQAARTALDDIQEWIRNDIDFEGFLRQDAQFRERYDSFQPEGFHYQVQVPTSYGPESKYFSTETEIEGKNLTKWDELVAEGHDMKEITSLAFKHYIQQITDGMAHSDIHPGNFRITPDNKLAILDRNFYLQISEQEQNVIFSLVNPLASAEAREQALASYFGIDGLSNTQELTPIVHNIATLMSSQQWNEARGEIVNLKQKGAKVPLNFTLLLKNFNSLRIMLEKAGFNNLTEAFLYSP